MGIFSSKIIRQGKSGKTFEHLLWVFVSSFPPSLLVHIFMSFFALLTIVIVVLI